LKESGQNLFFSPPNLDDKPSGHCAMKYMLILKGSMLATGTASPAAYDPTPMKYYTSVLKSGSFLKKKKITLKRESKQNCTDLG
jgi:hypothetical protein